MKDITNLLQTLDVEPASMRLYQLALTHRSFSKDNNERLEFIGDALLDLVIAEILYERFSDSQEGKLSHLRSLLVKGETLAELARELGLNQYLNLGQGERKSGGENRQSILADTFEALVGAIYLDKGFDCCKTIVLRLFSQRLATIKNRQGSKDAKTTLQEYLQSKQLDLPVYTLDKTTGKQHQQIFYVSCHVPELDMHVQAKGQSKKSAEQQAACDMMQLMKLENM